MDDLGIIARLLDQKILTILKLFANRSCEQFYLREISKETGIPVATTYRILGKLQRLRIIKLLHFKKFKLYELSNSEQANTIRKVLGASSQALKAFVDSVSRIPGVQTIIEHGTTEKSKANLLIIGDAIDASQMKRICTEILSTYNYKITHLTLTLNQFEQMNRMGLYSGEKKVIFQNKLLFENSIANKPKPVAYPSRYCNP